MKNELPERKRLRLKAFDYSTTGAYFITICTKDKKPLFSLPESRNHAAQMIEKSFLKTIGKYDGVESPIYVVMPNHFHAIITISRQGDNSPSVSSIVQDFKRSSTLEYIKMVKDGMLPPFDKQIWQRSFYDHIIRNADDYYQIAQYIIENPMRWKFDKLYIEY